MCSNKMYVWHKYDHGCTFTLTIRTALFNLKEEESTGMYVYTRMHTRIYKCTEGILDPHTEIPTVCTYVYTEGIAVLHI